MTRIICTKWIIYRKHFHNTVCLPSIYGNVHDVYLLYDTFHRVVYWLHFIHFIKHLQVSQTMLLHPTLPFKQRHVLQSTVNCSPLGTSVPSTSVQSVWDSNERNTIGPSFFKLNSGNVSVFFFIYHLDMTMPVWCILSTQVK